MDYRRIIESAYDRTAWQTLLHDIFGDKARFYDPPRPLALDKALIAQSWLLGSVELDDGLKIGVYEAELKHVDLARNRVGVRNLLAPEWHNRGFVGAFQFCYVQGSTELRFSYASETWGFDEKNNFCRKSTDTHRYTYLLGAGHRSRTACDQFRKLKASGLTLRDVTEAFSVEAVSRRFFDEYKQNYESIVEFVTGKRMVKAGGKWQEKETGAGSREILAAFAPFANPEKAVRDYVKKLMGRLVFLQFLQKKGWLGVPKGRSWADGDREFLRHLFDRFAKGHARADATASFVDSVLEPLFDDINTRRPGDLANPVLGTDVLVPYLNGGLFERDAADDVAFPLPVGLLERLFDFFDAYNFTIDENDPEDAEVGVDPEMLSRIFENLLEDNKDKGAFYTPKSIVEYMCRESLAAYLQTDLPEADKAPVAAFVKTHEAAGLASALRDDLLKRLREVKVCDPAIGSGAFPMGLLKELVACRKALGDPLAETSPAALKREIIESNIYGVDIEKGAVDIARLRFWLALVVDEESPHTLPNLDFKIMQGNSLVESFGGVRLDHILDDGDAADCKSGKRKGQRRESYYQTEMAFDGQDALNEIVRDKNALFNETRHEKKVELIKSINRNVKAFILHQLDRSSPWRTKIPEGQNDQFFLWHVWFADVFSRPGKSGFDIVIGNPPYIRPHHLSTEAKNSLWKAFTTFEKKADIYVCFMELALRLLSEGSVMSFIVSDGWLRLDSFAAIRKHILQTSAVKRIVDFTEDVFDSATVKTCIVILTRRQQQVENTIEIATAEGCEQLSALKSSAIPQVVFEQAYKNVFDLSYDAANCAIKSKIGSGAKRLDADFELSFGIKTGDDAKFLTHNGDLDDAKKLIRGADAGRYCFAFKGEYVIYRPNEMRKNKITARPGTKERFEQPKVLLRDTGGGLMGVFDGEGYYVKDMIIVSHSSKDATLLKSLLALLNSKAMRYFYETTFPTLHVQRDEVASLPIRLDFLEHSKSVFATLVDAIIAAKRSDPAADTSALEAEIDEKVFDLYGLTPEERAIVEVSVK